jgi:Spy/CpxP family protein refolding chaperone
MSVLRIKLCFVLVLLGGEVRAQTAAQDPTLEERLKLESELQDALRKYTPRHPHVVELEKELQQLNTKLRAAAPTDGPLKAGTTSPLTALQATVKGTFWRNPEWVKLLDLSADQQNKMDGIFQQYRLKLVDLNASLQKEELILEPLMANGRPAAEAQPRIITQIDRIADARAELEKANSRMLFGILQILTAEQWNKLPVSSKKVVPAPTK